MANATKVAKVGSNGKWGKVAEAAATNANKTSAKRVEKGAVDSAPKVTSQSTREKRERPFSAGDVSDCLGNIACRLTYIMKAMDDADEQTLTGDEVAAWMLSLDCLRQDLKDKADKITHHGEKSLCMFRDFGFDY